MIIVLALTPSIQIILLQVMTLCFMWLDFGYKPFKIKGASGSNFLNKSNVICESCFFMILLGKTFQVGKSKKPLQFILSHGGI